MMTYHVQFLLLVLAGWVNRQQQDVIDYRCFRHQVLVRVTLRRYAALNYSQNSAHDLRRALNGA